MVYSYGLSNKCGSSSPFQQCLQLDSKQYMSTKETTIYILFPNCILLKPWEHFLELSMVLEELV